MWVCASANIFQLHSVKLLLLFDMYVSLLPREFFAQYETMYRVYVGILVSITFYSRAHTHKIIGCVISHLVFDGLESFTKRHIGMHGR